MRMRILAVVLAVGAMTLTTGAITAGAAPSVRATGDDQRGR